MGAVMVRCPETGQDIPTGIVADRESFKATPVFFARVHCPICRTQHEWFAQEAWVCETEPRPKLDPFATSAVDLKFLSVLRRVHHRNFKSKTALES
jgi:hypothetical protein